MAATPDGLGRLFNVVFTASGRGVKLVDGSAVTFVSADAGSGDQVLTFTQRDSSGVNSEIDLNIFDNASTTVDAQSRVYVGSDVGDGAWTQAATSDANSFTNASTTNDTVVVTVRAEQLADGYDLVECTVTGGSCVGLLHELNVQRKPSNLRGISVA
ncbi:hypothetical protein HUN42_00012 [Streptomyces phage Dagobah]|nr:hypothetical protein HUN42_00012 [Streptomyces phage Dagobah]